MIGQGENIGESWNLDPEFWTWDIVLFMPSSRLGHLLSLTSLQVLALANTSAQRTLKDRVGSMAFLFFLGGQTC